ncbi:hypothetical protein B9Z55_008039 [Caenorhabditis nigoni]|uniref:Uncharacterized protein n=1 Tax=Caenorhabditis nigoni TaxID=1611254 RepID=A0A2G5VCC0_9PELO|nr:hypothetical protein B9Z55_008039 [Caenorhabditis nigoni]
MGQLKNFIDSLNSCAGIAVDNPNTKEDMTTNSFKNGTKETYGQAICCDELKFCSEPSEPFYTQIWFFAVCGGVGLLIIIAIIGVVYFFCIRKKRGGGKSGGGGSKSSESTSKKTHNHAYTSLLLGTTLKQCTTDEKDLLRSTCEKVFVKSQTVDSNSWGYILCCDQLKVCSGPTTKEEIENLTKLIMKMKLNQANTCSNIPTGVLNQDFIDSLLLVFEEKVEPNNFHLKKKFLRTCTLEHKKALKATCDRYIRTQSFKNGNVDTFGYSVC